MAKITKTWWGKRFLEALEKSMDSGRLSRGRSYSSPTRLLIFKIRNGVVFAHLKGKKNPYFGVYKTPYYDATISLEPISAAKWKRIISSISHNAAWLSRLLMDEMPDNIEQAFLAEKVYLLPYREDDLVTKCSCPDWANPCKHVAGTYYKVASMLDRDPFLLFELRGMDKTKLKKALAASPLGQALVDQWQSDEKTQNLTPDETYYTLPTLQTITPKDTPDWLHFWHSDKPLSALNTINETNNAMQNTSPAILIKKGGDNPAFWHHDQSFTDTMDQIYSKVLIKNKKVF